MRVHVTYLTKLLTQPPSYTSRGRSTYLIFLIYLQRKDYLNFVTKAHTNSNNTIVTRPIGYRQTSSLNKHFTLRSTILA